MCLGSTLQAEWNPEFLNEDEELYDISVVVDPEFARWKSYVIEHLQNSWCSSEKANLLMDLIFITKPSFCVEIGVSAGSSSLPIAAALKHVNYGHLFAIDAWSNEVTIRNLTPDDPNRGWWETVDMTAMHATFQSLLDSWSLRDYCTAIKASSEHAAPCLGQIDFLHLDGDYSETGSLNDISLYLPKVKKGGYVLISNLFIMINGKAPKLKSFCKLFDSCDIICEIEKDNAVLFRKR